MYAIDSQNAIDFLLDAVCIVRRDSTLVYVNPAFERIFGYAPQEAIGLRMFDLVHPQDLPGTQAQARSVMEGKLQLQFENRYLHKDGHTVHISWTARQIEDGQFRLAVAHDITERKRHEARQAAVYAISEAAHATEDLVALFTRVHQILGDLLAAQDFGVVLADPEGGGLSSPYPPESPPLRGPPPLHAAALCQRVIQSGETVLQLQDAGTPDLRYWLGVPLSTPRGTLGVMVLQGRGDDARHSEHDKDLLQFVSAQVATAVAYQQMQARLHRMAQYDMLTQLPNRQLLLDRLGVALARARREKTVLSLLFLDLDRFKHVNDTLGHAAGDLLLQQVAARLQACVRATDTVARLGGDEFVLLLEGGDSAGHSAGVQKKIAQGFSQAFQLDGHAVFVSPSLGIAHYPEHGEEPGALLRHADAAMYQDKGRPLQAHARPPAPHDPLAAAGP